MGALPMCTSKTLAVLGASALVAACTTSGPALTTPIVGPDLGRVATAQEVAAWDISIPPSGAGLPTGSGSAKQGESVYVAKCQACHGVKGVGKPADPLVGGIGSLTSGKAVLTVGGYWPDAATLFSYMRAALP